MFENIIGNDNIKKYLLDSVKNNKISHSYLFIGNDGIGKKMIAKEFAKIVLCTDNNKYCNKCKSCIEFDTDNNPDFLIIEPDGNSLKIDQIRDVQKKVNEKPIVSNKKVYIIDDSDKMTKEAQNCLLKTLEEPPEYVMIIIIGQNKSAFLPTIKSRCTMLHFNGLPEEQIKSFLKQNYNYNIESNIMLQSCQGSIGKAILLLEKKELYENLEIIINNLGEKNLIDLLNLSEIIYKAKDDKIDILNYINIILINLAKKSYKYAECISIVEETKKRINLNANFEMSVDNMLFNMWEIINKF